MNGSEIERRISEIVQYGRVCEVQPEKGLCRLDLGSRVSPLVRWFDQRAGNAKRHFSHPDMGEQALLICPYGDSSQGVALVGIYSGRMPLPDGAGSKVDVTLWGDGAKVLVDQNAHVVKIEDSYGSYIKFESGNIYLHSAGNIYLN